MTEKKIIRGFLDKTCLVLSMTPLPKGRNFGIKTAHDAEVVLRNSGYKFPKLWKELKPLCCDEIDVSFVIPVYNAGKYLSKCLDSIISQDTKFKYEVICVNDGSTDGSAEVLADYSARYPHLRILTQNNQGISLARNHGIEVARGKYVGFIDNDDCVTSDYVESIMQVAIANNADLVQTDYDEITPYGTKVRTRRRPYKVYSKDEYTAHVFDFQGFIWGGGNAQAHI